MFKQGDVVVVDNTTSRYFGMVGRVQKVSGPKVTVFLGGRGRPPILLASDINLAQKDITVG